jgi:hypothetical protein
MKKVLLALLSIAIAFTALSPAQAEDQKVLAIIDSAINSNNFPSIIHEVCYTINKDWACPNGELYMEGKNAASAPWPVDQISAVYHGDMMVKSALTVNPNLKIVFIRYRDIRKDGSSRGETEAMTKAISWVSKNASKYSIDALSISFGSATTGNLERCTADTATINAIASLTTNNVPVFIATGNEKRRDVVGFPSCINGAIGVGALANATQLEGATNSGPGLDMVAPGKVKITNYNRYPIDTAGSSVATAVSAASYVDRNTFKTFQEYLSSLSKILIGNTLYIRN